MIINKQIAQLKEFEFRYQLMRNNRVQFPFKYGKNNPNMLQEQEAPSFSSGMTSQQKFNSVVQSMRSSLPDKTNSNGCEMHPKISSKCRKCQLLIKNQTIIQNALQQSNGFILLQQTPQCIKLNNDTADKSHINQKLQLNIKSSGLYKKAHLLKSVKEVLQQLSHDEIYICAYRKGTTENPSDFMVILFRILQLKLTYNQLIIMLRDNNVNVRALALLYVRIAVDFQHIYPWLKKAFKDNKLINAEMTVGQLAIKLLNQQYLDINGIRLPRIPTRIQKAITLKLKQAVIAQNNIEQQYQKNIKLYRQQLNQRQQRQRSRQKNQKRSRSSSSSSSSSNSSFSSSSSQQQVKTKQKVQQKVAVKIQEVKQVSNINQVRQRIKKALLLQQQKQKRRKLIEQKYEAQSKIQVKQDSNQYYDQQSNSVQNIKLN